MQLCQDLDEDYCTLLEKKKDLSLLDEQNPYAQQRFVGKAGKLAEATAAGQY
jgi:hypothetical protein